MPNVKILVLSHHLRDLGVTHRVHLWLSGKRVVDVLLAIIEFFLLALTTAALLSEICRNRRFSTGLGHLERNRNPSMDRYNNVSTTLPLEVFTRRNFAADFFRQKLKFSQKIANRVLCHPLGDLGVTYTVHLWLVGKRVVDFLLALIELFSLALTVEALRVNIGQNCAV